MLLACCRSPTMQSAPETLQPVVQGIVRVGYGALVWTLVFGYVRGLTYRKYEWAEAAGRDQVTALVVKHIFLVILVIVGCVMLYRLHRLGKVGDREAAGS